MTKTFDDAVKLEYVAFKQPFTEAYVVTNCDRRVKIVLDDYCVHYVRFKAANRGQWKSMGRKEFENANKQRCVKNALKWVNA